MCPFQILLQITGLVSQNMHFTNLFLFVILFLLFVFLFPECLFFALI